MAVLASTGSIEEVAELPEVCTTIGSCSTSTILGFGKVSKPKPKLLYATSLSKPTDQPLSRTQRSATMVDSRPQPPLPAVAPKTKPSLFSSFSPAISFSFNFPSLANL